MKIVLAALIIGPLVLASPAATFAADARMQTAATESASDHDSYVQKAEAEMRDWRQKLQDFDTQAGAKGETATAAAKKDLDIAWTRAEAESQKLATVSAAGWDSAKRSYETLSQDLKDTWHRVNPAGE